MKYGLLTNLIRFPCAVLGVWLFTLTPSTAVTFVPPDDNTFPTYSDGGASRSSIRFIPPPDNAAPVGAAGGASRIGFIPPPDNSAPDQAAGGASRIGFTPPPDNSAPDQAAGGASREGDAEDIALFLPEQESNAVSEFVSAQATAMLAVTPSSLYGLTISARPTVMAYLPRTEAHTAIFSLKDKNQSVVYRQLIPLDGASGILKISLPEDAPELSVGEHYQWFVTLQTEAYVTPGSPYVTAWIKRVDLSSVLAEAGLSVQNDLAKAKVLAQAGIWYDAAEQLSELRSNPRTQGETAADWTEFLTSVGLDRLLEHSFLD